MVSKLCFEKTVLLLVVGIACHIQSTIAFTPTPVARLVSVATRSSFVLNSSESEPVEEPAPSNSQDEQPAAVPQPPPPVPRRRLDPLMASLTKSDPTASTGPTKNVPFFGEVAVDGGLTVLVPAAVIAILGFILSFVVAFNSSDEIVSSLLQVPDNISQTATTKTNMVYDENACRGLCSSQEQDLEGLRSFMESLRK